MLIHAVLICDSIHDVMKAERVVRNAGLWCDMVPAPRDLSSDCGMALGVRADEFAAAQAAVAGGAVRYRGWYVKTAQGYQPASPAAS